MSLISGSLINSHDQKILPVIGDLRVVLDSIDSLPLGKDPRCQLFFNHLKFLNGTKQGSRAFTILKNAPFLIPVYFNKNEDNSVKKNALHLDLTSSSCLIVQKNNLRYFEETYFSVVTLFHELLHLIILMQEVRKKAVDGNSVQMKTQCCFLGSDQYTNLEEFSVINGSFENDLSENGLRKELGLPVRVSHKGISKKKLPKTIIEQLSCYSLYNLTGNLKNLLSDNQVSFDQIIQSKALVECIMNKHKQSFEMLQNYLLQKNPNGQKVLSFYLDRFSDFNNRENNLEKAVLFYGANNLLTRLNKLLCVKKLNVLQIFRSGVLIQLIKTKNFSSLNLILEYILSTDPKGPEKIFTYIKAFGLLEIIKSDKGFSALYQNLVRKKSLGFIR